MRKNLRYFLSGALLALSSLSVSAAYWTDDELNPDISWFNKESVEAEYTVSTPEQLAGLAKLVNSGVSNFDGITIKLGANIDLAKTIGEEQVKWQPVGLSLSKSFKGDLDGQGKTVDGIYVDETSQAEVGLFGYIESASVKDLTIGANSSIKSAKYSARAGLIAGKAKTTVIENCTAYGSVETTSSSTGAAGIIGASNGYSKITGCKNYVTVTGSYYTGGIVGSTYGNDTIVNNVNYGVISGIQTGVTQTGGIIGYLYGDTKVVNNLNVGEIVRGGGIAGKVAAGTSYVTKGYFSNNINVNSKSEGDQRDGVSPTFTFIYSSRNYFVTNGLENNLKAGFTELSAEELKSAELVAELNANAGYLNSMSEDKYAAVKWELNVTDGYPELSADVAAKTYKAEVAPSLMGELTTAPLAADDASSLYYEAGANVLLPVKANDGFNFNGLKLGDDTTVASNEFTMPANDIKIEMLFDAGEVTAWADMAKFAVADTDYSLDGTSYDVMTAKGLAYVAAEVNAGNCDLETVITLRSDIELGVTNASGAILTWTPMGTKDTPFEGIFDGGDFTVDNVVFATAPQYAGLIGYASGAEIINVVIGGNSKMHSDQKNLGAVVGAAVDTKIANCHNNSDITSTAMYCGGIVSDLTGAKSEIYNCTNSGDITNTNLMAGGIAAKIGDNNAVVTLYNCSNSGDITSKGTAGGIVAMLQTPTSGTDRSRVINSYNTGNIKCTALNMAGGIVGMINMYSEIKNCVSSGASVTLEGATGKYAGAIVGANNGANEKAGLITRCYYLDETTITGLEPNTQGNSLTAEQMYGSAIATEMTNYAGYLNKIDFASYSSWSSSKTSCPTHKAGYEKSSDAYILTLNESTNGSYELTTPAAVLAQDSTTIFIKKNTSITFAPTADKGYAFYALKVNGEEKGEYVNNFRTEAGDVTVDVLFSYPRRWDFIAGDAVEDTDYTLGTDTIKVATALGLAYIADRVNGGDNLSGKVVELTADIDLYKENLDGDKFTWQPIGLTMAKPFSGKFDGKGYEIKNMTINTTASNAALFGYIKSSTVENFSITGKSSVYTSSTNAGAAVGETSTNAVIKNVNNIGCSVESASSYAGGIVAKSGYGCIVRNCSSSADVTAANNAGGLIGYYYGKLDGCLSTGSVSSEGKGGAFFSDGYNVTAERCYYGADQVSAATDKVVGTLVDAANIKSEALAAELAAYAGSVNVTDANAKLSSWVVADGAVVATGKLAANAYTVSVAEGIENGTVALPALLTDDEGAVFYATEGAKVMLDVTANDEYELSALTVNSVETEVADEYSFVMPSEDAVIGATFTKVSGVDSVGSDSVKVYAANGTIYVAVTDFADVTIYNVSGTVVAFDAGVANAASYELAAGVYVVKVGDDTYKVLVK